MRRFKIGVIIALISIAIMSCTKDSTGGRYPHFLGLYKGEQIVNHNYGTVIDTFQQEVEVEFGSDNYSLNSLNSNVSRHIRISFSEDMVVNGQPDFSYDNWSAGGNSSSIYINFFNDSLFYTRVDSDDDISVSVTFKGVKTP